MPLEVASEVPTILIRRAAFERDGLTRAEFDARFNLTPDEFRVEGDVIAVGPLHGDGAVAQMTQHLEGSGLEYYEDFFDLSGNWPTWLRLFVMAG